MRIFQKTFFAAAVALFSASMAMADPIEGNWRTQSGENAKISKCGGSFCIKLTTGQYNGSNIGRLKGSNGKYSGTVTDPSDDRQYRGSATVSGNSMKLTGCALRVFCQTQNWRKF